MELALLTLSMIIIWNSSEIFQVIKNFLIPVEKDYNSKLMNFFQTVIHCPPCSSFYIAAIGAYFYSFLPFTLVFATIVCAFIHIVYYLKTRFNV